MISHDCGVEGVKVIDICRGFSESTVGEAEGGAEFEVAIVLTTRVILSPLWQDQLSITLAKSLKLQLC